jgi:hypothetical protein
LKERADVADGEKCNLNSKYIHRNRKKLKISPLSSALKRVHATCNRLPFYFSFFLDHQQALKVSVTLKVPKRENFDRCDFRYFTPQSLYV